MRQRSDLVKTEFGSGSTSRAALRRSVTMRNA